MNTITIGSKVVATWPSGWQLGGTVIAVITPMGQEPSYFVRFSTDAHHTFTATNVTLST